MGVITQHDGFDKRVSWIPYLSPRPLGDINDWNGLYFR